MPQPFRHSVSESDIDWIICIELNSNGELRDWLAGQLFGFDVRHVEAWRSVADPRLGESDLLWLVEDGHAQKHLTLIENKIGAQAQPSQCERYVLRGQQYSADGVCDEFRTAIIAPAKYSSADSNDYDHRIDYELLQNWFQENCPGERGTFVARLLEAAVTKASFAAPPDPEITAFRRSIWELAQVEFPELGLDQPAAGREYWVEQKYEGFYIKYKMKGSVAKGYHQSVVDLELAGRAGDVEQLRIALDSELAGISASVQPTGKSAAIRIEVPCIKPPQFDEAAVRAALQAWQKLLSWRRSRAMV